MLNYRVWVSDEYRGLMKAEGQSVAFEIARQWSGDSGRVRVEPTKIPFVLTPVELELKKLIGSK